MGVHSVGYSLHRKSQKEQWTHKKAPEKPPKNSSSLDNAKLRCVAPEVKHSKDAAELMQCDHFLIVDFSNIISTDSKPVHLAWLSNRAAGKKL